MFPCILSISCVNSSKHQKFQRVFSIRNRNLHLFWFSSLNFRFSKKIQKLLKISEINKKKNLGFFHVFFPFKKTNFQTIFKKIPFYPKTPKIETAKPKWDAFSPLPVWPPTFPSLPLQSLYSRSQCKPLRTPLTSTVSAKKRPQHLFPIFVKFTNSIQKSLEVVISVQSVWLSSCPTLIKSTQSRRFSKKRSKRTCTSSVGNWRFLRLSTIQIS